MIASGPVYTVLKNGVNVGTANLPAGTYQIVPSNVVQKEQSANYTIVYKSGTLTEVRG